MNLAPLPIRALRLSHAHAQQVLGTTLWPDHWSPGQHDDYLYLEGAYGELYQRSALNHRVVGGLGEYCVEGTRVTATDKWDACVVLASLLSSRPSPELLACATVLLATELVLVVAEGGR